MEQFTALESTLDQEELKESLTPLEINKIDAYWRAANYLSVGQIYLLDNPLLKKSMIPYFENELLNHELEKLTENKRAFLKDKYGKVQVNPREINLFYLTDTRNRIVLQNGDYHVLNKN